LNLAGINWYNKKKTMEPNNANTKKIVIIVVILVVIAAVVVLVVLGGNIGSMPGAGTGSFGNSGGANSSTPAASVTHLPTPANVVVPDAGAVGTGGVAVPQVESPAAPGVSAKYRSFNIIVQNGEFIPSTIAVNLGDTVNLQIGAVGGTYDFTQPDLGFNVPLPNGENKKIQFAAMSAGKFVFYCSSCGGPAKGPVGYIVVAGK